MYWKFRLWLGVNVMTWGMWILGLGKGKWEAVSLMGKAPEFEPIFEKMDRLKLMVEQGYRQGFMDGHFYEDFEPDKAWNSSEIKHRLGQSG